MDKNSGKKRVLIFSTAYLPLVGGAEVAVKEITDRISDLEFVMITAKLDSKLPHKEKIGNIEVHRLGKGNHWDKYRLILQGARYAQNLGHFDAIWGIMASYAGFAALRYKKRENRPFLLTLQEGDSRWQIYKHVWWCWPYFKQIFKRADYIQAISNYLAKWAEKMAVGTGFKPVRTAGLKPVRTVEVVPNGVGTGFKPVRTIADSKSACTVITVITVSRLVKKNGVADLIKAMKYLSDDTHLLIAGEGKLKNKLVSLVNQLGLVNRVHFLGNVSHADLPKYLWASDVFCRPSLSEGLGSAFLEAMATGLPIVGTNIGGIPDFLKDGETGWFCKIRDPKSIAEKTRYITDERNKDEVLRVVENAKKLVEEKYNWDLIASKMRNIFLSFLRKQESSH